MKLKVIRKAFETNLKIRKIFVNEKWNCKFWPNKNLFHKMIYAYNENYNTYNHRSHTFSWCDK